jgi:hypothetical protein
MSHKAAVKTLEALQRQGPKGCLWPPKCQSLKLLSLVISGVVSHSEFNVSLIMINPQSMIPLRPLDSQQDP